VQSMMINITRMTKPLIKAKTIDNPGTNRFHGMQYVDKKVQKKFEFGNHLLCIAWKIDSKPIFHVILQESKLTKRLHKQASRDIDWHQAFLMCRLWPFQSLGSEHFKGVVVIIERDCLYFRASIKYLIQ
jgi:hypothetical protein